MVNSNSLRVHLPVLPNDSFDSGLSHAESARIHGVGVSTSKYAAKWCRRGILPAGIYFMCLPDSGSGGETVVEVPGFEPGQAEPKSVVLPLHHTSVQYAKIRIIYAYPQKYLCILIGRGLTGMPPRQLSNEGKRCRGGIPVRLAAWGQEYYTVISAISIDYYRLALKNSFTSEPHSSCSTPLLTSVLGCSRPGVKRL